MVGRDTRGKFPDEVNSDDNPIDSNPVATPHRPIANGRQKQLVFDHLPHRASQKTSLILQKGVANTSIDFALDST